MENNNISKMQVINYSEKAIALVGDPETQRANKKKLKELGGRYNPHLSCGAGWVFSRRKCDIKKLNKFVTANGGTGLSE